MADALAYAASGSRRVGGHGLFGDFRHSSLLRSVGSAAWHPIAWAAWELASEAPV